MEPVQFAPGPCAVNKIFESLVEPARVVEQPAPVVPGPGETAVDLKRLAVGGDRLVATAQLGQMVSHVVGDAGVVRVERRRSGEQPDMQLGTVGLGCERAERLQRMHHMLPWDPGSRQHRLPQIDENDPLLGRDVLVEFIDGLVDQPQEGRCVDRLGQSPATPSARHGSSRISNPKERSFTLNSPSVGCRPMPQASRPRNQEFRYSPIVPLVALRRLVMAASPSSSAARNAALNSLGSGTPAAIASNWIWAVIALSEAASAANNFSSVSDSWRSRDAMMNTSRK